MKLSLLQKVLISAKTLYDKNVVTFTSKDLFHEFINNDFFTPEKDGEKAMVRRVVDLKNMGLVEITGKFGKYTVYKLTHHGKRVKPYMVHIGVSLLMRDPSKELKDMPKRLKTGRSDRIRTPVQESEVKSENNILNKNITDILKPMSEKPKHTIREHFKSLFGF